MLNPGPVLARGRAAAEDLMVDACIIQRVAYTPNPETGSGTTTSASVYAGKCRFQQAAPPAGAAAVGEATVYIGATTLSIPIAAAEPHVEDLVTCTASSLDPALVGKTWRIRGVLRKSHATARRVELQGVDD